MLRSIASAAILIPSSFERLPGYDHLRLSLPLQSTQVHCQSGEASMIPGYFFERSCLSRTRKHESQYVIILAQLWFSTQGCHASVQCYRI